jgi:diamine N-acetyltransferase
MEDITLSRITPAHLEALQKIGKQTFIETFAAHNSEEDMTAYLTNGFSHDKLTAELNNTESEFYFAHLAGDIIGYLKINTGSSQTEIRDANGLEIERIYVLQQYQGMKVGQRLYEWALQIARDRNLDYVWLGVWEYNTKAMAFYKKNGFVAFDKHVFKLGADDQTDIMMKKALK